MGKVFDMDLAQHIKKDYYPQNLRKYSVKANFARISAKLYSNGNLVICFLRIIYNFMISLHENGLTKSSLNILNVICLAFKEYFHSLESLKLPNYNLQLTFPKFCEKGFT